jgi:hypothetical protein
MACRAATGGRVQWVLRKQFETILRNRRSAAQSRQSIVSIVPSGSCAGAAADAPSRILSSCQAPPVSYYDIIL